MNQNSEENAIFNAIIQVIKEKKPQNVKQLTTLVKERLSTPEEQIIKAILKLQNEGKIKLEKQPQPTPPKLASYLKTQKALWYWATIAMAAATTLIVFTIPEELYPWIYTRYILGAIFVLWLPGYSFIKALFPTQAPIKTSKESLDTIERIALSLGMSLALVPIVGLLLNYTPWGIRLTPIVLSLLALTLIFATAAVIREHKAQKQKEKQA